jgi:hypothetical protein
MSRSVKLETVLRGTLAAIGAALLQAAMPAEALAQYYPGPRVYYAPAPELSARERADAAVRALGLRPVGRAERHGPFFIIEAVGQEGTLVEVTLDRRSSRVLGIVRVGPSAPRIVRAPLVAPRPDEDDEFDDQSRPAGREELGARARELRESRSGPSVITREGVDERDDLPEPRYAPRPSPDITGSVPRSAGRAPADPLVGVPREFRGPSAEPDAAAAPRVAARPPAPRAPESAPLPRPRPSDAPALARQEPPKTTPEPQAKPKPDPEKVPDAQTFE